MDVALPSRDATVTLREITKDTVRSILRLEVAPEQIQFVAPNAVSISEAYFHRENAWFRAIYADEIPIGFMMLYDDPSEPTYYLWRFMIDKRFQGRGFGWRALALVVEHVRSRPNATEMTLSYVPGEGNPGEFYHKFGFVDTGEVDEGELVSRLVFDV
jgi:diamine N-acetyltransferase